MTRPSDIKPREGDVPGTTFEQYVIGETFPEVRFTITPDIIDEYTRSVDGDVQAYKIGGRPVALPSVLCVYLMAVMYRKYPPLQGGIMAGNKFSFHGPIWADEETEIVGTGKVENKFEKRGRRYIQYSATFKNGRGEHIATAVNTSTFPA